jgi:hypothetical protein
MSELHSPMGGSGIERLIECTGSYQLIEALKAAGQLPEDDEEWTKEGTAAHKLAEECLNSGEDAWERLPPGASADTASAVQVYLDHVRSVRGYARRYVEFKIANQAFHPLMFSTLDSADLGNSLVIRDYKHGIGVCVTVEHNAQLMYYAKCFIDGDNWPADVERLCDDATIELEIIQPRGWMEPIRSWRTTAGYIREWAQEKLLPAMLAAEVEPPTFHMGEHCRFCPAKLACPAHRALASGALCAGEGREIIKAKGASLPVYGLADMDDETIGWWYSKADLLGMMKRSIEKEVYRRAVVQGKTSEHWKLVDQKVDREWKPDAPVERVFKEDAWEPAKLKSPAKIEALPGGTQFVEEWATKPKPALTVASMSSKAKERKAPTTAEKFAKALDAPAEMWE